MNVTMPDGTIVQNVPDDMSKADFTAMYERNTGKSISTPQAQPAQEQPSALEGVAARTGRIAAGGLGTLADIPAQIGQAGYDFTRGLQQLSSRVGYGKYAQDQVAPAYNIPMPSQGVLSAYDAATGGAGIPQNDMQKVVQAGGQMLAGGGLANLAAKAPQVAGQAAKMMNLMAAPATKAGAASFAGAGAGGEAARQQFPDSAIAPVVGALVGGAPSLIAAPLSIAKQGVQEGLARGVAAITPSVGGDIATTAKKAMEYNIPLTRTQISGSEGAKTVASALGKIPLGGAGGFAKDQQKAFNREVLSTIGVTAEKAAPSVLAGAYGKITKGFDDALAGQRIKLNDNMIERLVGLEREAASNLSDTSEAYKIVTNQMKKFLKYRDADGMIKGEHLGQLRSELSKLSTNTLPNAKSHIRDLKNFVMDVSVDGAPARKAQLQDSIDKYRNYAVLKPLFNKAKNGDISTSLLLGQVAKSFGDFERGGGGKLGDLARISRDLLKDTIPDSATAQRSLLYKALQGAGGLAAGTAAVINPAVITGAAVPLGISQTLNRANQSQRLVRNALGLKSGVKIPKKIYKMPPAVALQAIKQLQEQK